MKKLASSPCSYKYIFSSCSQTVRKNIICLRLYVVIVFTNILISDEQFMS